LEILPQQLEQQGHLIQVVVVALVEGRLLPAVQIPMAQMAALVLSL
jgi:hypothetical protein